MRGVIDLTSPARSKGSVSPIPIRIPSVYTSASKENAVRVSSFDLLDALNEGDNTREGHLNGTSMVDPSTCISASSGSSNMNVNMNYDSRGNNSGGGEGIFKGGAEMSPARFYKNAEKKTHRHPGGLDLRSEGVAFDDLEALGSFDMPSMRPHGSSYPPAAASLATKPSSTSSSKRDRSTSLSEALRRPKVIDPLVANSSNVLLAEEDDNYEMDEEEEEEEDILIGIPKMVSKKEDKASSKQVGKALKVALRAEKNEEKHKEKNHDKALRVAECNELHDRIDMQREHYANQSSKAETRSAKSGHAACEVTMITDKDTPGHHRTNEIIASKAGVTVFARRATDACAAGVNLWLRRPKECGGFFTSANVTDMSVDERRENMLPFVVIQFPPAEYLRLVMSDPYMAEFSKLSGRVRVLRGDLARKEGVPNIHRLVLIVTEMTAAINMYIAEQKKIKNKLIDAAKKDENMAHTREQAEEAEMRRIRLDSEKQRLTNKGPIVFALNEASAYLMIRHGVEVVMLPKLEEVSEYLKKVTCLLGDQCYAKPVTDLDCTPKVKLSTSSKKRGHEDTDIATANSMEEFGDGYAPPLRGTSSVAGGGDEGVDSNAQFRQDWIKMLVQVKGLTQPKAETFKRSRAGSCPKVLRSTLSHSLQPCGSRQSNSQLQEMFGPRRETVLSNKVEQMFSSSRGNGTVDIVDGTP